MLRVSQVNTTEQKLSDFRKLVSSMQTVDSISSILVCDSVFHMPEAATRTRSIQQASLNSQYHKILISHEMQDLIENLSSNDIFTALNETDQAIVKAIKKEHDESKDIPESLIQELTETIEFAQSKWQEAYKKKDFKVFAPSLERIVVMQRQVGEIVKPNSSPYYALLDEFEPGMPASEIDGLFEMLKQELIPIVRNITSSCPKPNKAFLEQEYSKRKQKNLCKDLLQLIGFDFTRGRLDFCNDPFTMAIDSNDIRLVTGTYGNNLPRTIRNALHEGGHGLFYQGINPELAGTPLYDSSSVSMNEAQARLYEFFIGTSLSFGKFYFPKLKKRFPEELSGITLDKFYKAFNIIEPSCDWDNADEIVDKILIVIQYEIEKDLIEGRLSVEDVIEAWNAKVQEYLGITPKDDSESALQNSHWSDGNIGYFPSYLFGDVYAAQIYSTLKRDIPALGQKVEEEVLLDLKEWLKEQINKYGKLKTTDEILKIATGEGLNPEYLTHYIKDKYSELYQTSL